MGFMSRFCWPVHDLHILLCPKSIRFTCCAGRDIDLDTHKVSLKKARHQGKHTIAQKTDVALAIKGSIQFTPVVMVDGTQYLDLGTTVTVRGLDARIYQSLPLPAAHISTTTTVKQREMRIITEDTAPPVPEVPPSVGSPTHMAASPVIQSQSRKPGGKPRPITSRQKPVYNAPNWQPPPNKVDHLHAQTRSQDETIVPDHSDQLSAFSDSGQAVTHAASRHQAIT